MRGRRAAERAEGSGRLAACDRGGVRCWPYATGVISFLDRACKIRGRLTPDEIEMEVIDRLNNVRDAWNLSFSHKYCEQAVIDYTVPDFLQFVGGLIPRVFNLSRLTSRTATSTRTSGFALSRSSTSFCASAS